MVEPVSLTLGMIAAMLVAKISEKATDKVASGVVEGVTDAGSGVVGWLRSKLGTPKTLDLVEAAPDSARAVKVLAETIDAEIVDADDVAELRRLVDEVKTRDHETYQSAIGHHIVQASNSTVTITAHGWT